MGNTCAAYWMPPIAVIAPTMIANGGSDSKGMCVLCSEVCVFREFLLLFQKTCEEEEKRKRKKRNVGCVFF